jgi:hypothetical protein
MDSNTGGYGGRKEMYHKGGGIVLVGMVGRITSISLTAATGIPTDDAGWFEVVV